MPIGNVKWFNNAKGYGFIRPEAGGDDLFVHYSYINMDGYKSLKAGQQVEYEVQPSATGFHAVNLRIVLSDRPDTQGSVSASQARAEEA